MTGASKTTCPHCGKDQATPIAPDCEDLCIACLKTFIVNQTVPGAVSLTRWRRKLTRQPHQHRKSLRKRFMQDKSNGK